MQFIKELVEEMAGPDDNLTGPGPQNGTAPPPQGEHKDDGPNPTNGPEVGVPTFQQLLASLKFLEDKVNHHHAEYNAKHGVAGGAPGPQGGEKPGEHTDPNLTAPVTAEPETKVFLKNSLKA